jgi:hypothetical protein
MERRACAEASAGKQMTLKKTDSRGKADKPAINQLLHLNIS